MPKNGTLGSHVKRMVKLRQVDKSSCGAKYGTTLRGDVMCAMSKSSRTACIGDSGGALMAIDVLSRMTVVGIFSPANDIAGFCQRDGLPGIYTDVSLYKDWIHANIRD